MNVRDIQQEGMSDEVTKGRVMEWRHLWNTAEQNPSKEPKEVKLNKTGNINTETETQTQGIITCRRKNKQTQRHDR